jgi:hypothetical protein
MIQKTSKAAADPSSTIATRGANNTGIPFTYIISVEGILTDGQRLPKRAFPLQNQENNAVPRFEFGAERYQT